MNAPIVIPHLTIRRPFYDITRCPPLGTSPYPQTCSLDRDNFPKTHPRCESHLLRSPRHRQSHHCQSRHRQSHHRRVRENAMCYRNDRNRRCRNRGQTSAGGSAAGGGACPRDHQSSPTPRRNSNQLLTRNLVLGVLRHIEVHPLDLLEAVRHVATGHLHPDVLDPFPGKDPPSSTWSTISLASSRILLNESVISIVALPQRHRAHLLPRTTSLNREA